MEQDIKKFIEDCEKEISSIEDIQRKNEQRKIVKDLWRKYKGEDEVISSEDYKKILEQQNTGDQLKVMTKIPRLDEIIDGFREGNLVVVSGATKQGKTSFCQTLTENFDEHALWFTFEVPPAEFMTKFQKMPLFYLPKTMTGNTVSWLEKKIVESMAKFDTKIIFIDHLHYIVDMASMHSNLSIQIGMVMRELKKIALKWEIIIFLVAHIKKTKIGDIPQLEDMRDCLPADQLIYINGERIRVDKIKKGDNVLSRRGIGKLQSDYITDIWNAGIKKIFRLTTKTGRQIECSDGHKFYAATYKKANKFGANQGCGIAGWTELKNLVVGQKISVVKNYPDTNIEEISIERAKLLGWIVGDGHITKNYHTEITVETEEETEYLKKLAFNSFGIEINTTQYKDKNAFRVYLSNKSKENNLRTFLKENKFNPVGKDKYVPEIIFKQSKRIIGVFLSGLFQADGSVGKNGNGEFGVSYIISYHTISERLSRDVQHLLSRLGIVGFLRKQSQKSSGFRTENTFIWSIAIRGYDIIRFKRWIGFMCRKQRKFIKLIGDWSSNVRKKEKEIYFEPIKSIELIGEKETYDISVRGHHVSLKNNSFCVNDFITHNSSFIAQEADIVIMVTRLRENEDKDSDFINEAGVAIIAHRRTGKMGSVRLLYRDNKFSQITDDYENN